MEEENVAERLTGSGSQVLLFLALYRTQAKHTPGAQVGEFAAFRPDLVASRLGQTGSSLLSALVELERANLIRIVPHVGIPMQVILSSFPPAGEKREDDVLDLLERCQRADTSGDKRERVRALQAVWDDAFPVVQYPYQRLTRDTADRWLANGRSVEWLARVIYKAIDHATAEIRAPRAYVERAIQTEEEFERRRGEVVEGGGITDELRAWAKKLQEQYGKETLHSAGHHAGIAG